MWPIDARECPTWRLQRGGKRPAARRGARARVGFEEEQPLLVVVVSVGRARANELREGMGARARVCVCLLEGREGRPKAPKDVAASVELVYRRASARGARAAAFGGRAERRRSAGCLLRPSLARRRNRLEEYFPLRT
jgi:hypothetical protein